MTKIVIVSKEMYGNTDFLEYSRVALSKGYSVDYITTGVKLGVTVTSGLNLIVVDKFFTKSPLFFSIYVLFFLYKNYRASDVFIHVRYYSICSLLSILKLVKYDLCCDIRSGCVSRSPMYNKFRNQLTRIEVRCYRFVSILSAGLATNIFKLKRFHVLRLGANIGTVINDKKQYNTPLKFVYVGTLFQRDIPLLARTFHDTCCLNNLSYILDVFGGGDEKVASEISGISEFSNHVAFKGFLKRDNLEVTLKQYDVGISYIPIKEIFEYQPPTKNFEYLLSGLPVVATSTKANIDIITNNHNGWLIEDDGASIARFLTDCNFPFITQKKCIESVKDRSWENIFDTDYLNLIRSVKCQNC
jgi:glycosyltransferase involved in cell wall biosynthesis